MKILAFILILFLTLTTNYFGQTSEKNLMEQRFSIITLGVSDLKKSADFYENKFGWKHIGADNSNIIFYQLNGIHLSLYPRNKLAEDAVVDSIGNGFKSLTITYLARSEKEVDGIIKKLREKGVKIVKEPQKVFWGGYSSYVSDPDGNLWEIAYNPFLIIDEKGNIAVKSDK